MIRQATQKDIPAIRDLVCLELEKRGWTPYDPYSAEALIRIHVGDGRRRVCFIEENEDGEICGVALGMMNEWAPDFRLIAGYLKMHIGGPEISKAFDDWTKEQDGMAVVRSCLEEGAGPRFRRI